MDSSGRVILRPEGVNLWVWDLREPRWRWTRKWERCPAGCRRNGVPGISQPACLTHLVFCIWVSGYLTTTWYNAFSSLADVWAQGNLGIGSYRGWGPCVPLYDGSHSHGILFERIVVTRSLFCVKGAGLFFYHMALCLLVVPLPIVDNPKIKEGSLKKLRPRGRPRTHSPGWAQWPWKEGLQCLFRKRKGRLTGYVTQRENSWKEMRPECQPGLSHKTSLSTTKLFPEVDWPANLREGSQANWNSDPRMPPAGVVSLLCLPMSQAFWDVGLRQMNFAGRRRKKGVLGAHFWYMYILTFDL